MRMERKKKSKPREADGQIKDVENYCGQPRCRSILKCRLEQVLMRHTLLVSTLAILSALTSGAAAQQSSTTAYNRQIREWQKQRAKALMAEEGWFSLAGLFWLKPGTNSLGSAGSSDIVLPPSAPKNLGVLELNNGHIQFKPQAVEGLTVDGKPAQSKELNADITGKPDKIQYRSLTMIIIKRGERFALRLKDNQSEARRNFHGLKFFPVDARWRLQARFIPYHPPKQISIPTILGTTIQMPSPGRVDFTWNGKQYSLDPVLEEPDSRQLFFIFRDRTAQNGETYGAGRFLYTPLPKDGRLTLDFNRAENPPCAYTPYATCPLPPPENKLDLAIRAGEKSYSKH
jgi:uncharacterized protein (DUF1684 family)